MKQLLLAALCTLQVISAVGLQAKSFKSTFPKLLRNKSLEYRPVSNWQGEELSLYARVPWKMVAGLSTAGSLLVLVALLTALRNRRITVDSIMYGALGALCLGVAGKSFLEGRVRTLLFTLDSVGIKEHGKYVMKWNDVESVVIEGFHHNAFHTNCFETARNSCAEDVRYLNKIGDEIWFYKETDNLPIEFIEFLKVIGFFLNKYKKPVQAQEEKLIIP